MLLKSSSGLSSSHSSSTRTWKLPYFLMSFLDAPGRSLEALHSSSRSGIQDVAGAHPALACLLRQGACQEALAGSREPLQYDIAAALHVTAGGELGYLHPVEIALLREVYPPDVCIRIPQMGPFYQLPHLAVDEGRMRLVHGHLHAFGERHTHARLVVLGLDCPYQAGCAHIPELPVGLAPEHRHRSSPP